MSNLIAVLGGLPDAGWVVDELLAANYRVAWISKQALPVSPYSDVCQVYQNRSITKVTGYVGDFKLHLAVPEESVTLGVAAIIVATGNQRLALEEDHRTPVDRRVISTWALNELLEKPKELASRAALQRQHLLFGLDMHDLSGKQASTETLELALRARRQWHCEVSVLYRELQVDSDLLEAMTRSMRSEGIVFHRWHDAQPVIDAAGIRIKHADGDLQGDLLIIPPAVIPRPDNADLAQVLHINVGADGYFQQLNVRSYRPGLSNRKGIFLVGRCHLDTDDSGARADAVQAAANVDILLSQTPLQPETVIAQVDSNKCIRCLTCIRTCPHYAIALAEYNEVIAARVNELACFGCGACAANCPAKAISLVGPDVPAWLQESALETQIG
ncbi:MAG: 4Fe-4S binding protein [Anaerolineae bacterium]